MFSASCLMLAWHKKADIKKTDCYKKKERKHASDTLTVEHI
jgi:hypothetical protein